MRAQAAILGVLGLGLGLLGACAKANPAGAGGDGGNGGSGSGGSGIDASCGDHCDTDGDGVIDPNDTCPDTPSGAPVNAEGCADSQLMSTPRDFPPFGLTWTSAGDLGRAGGLTWTYIGIQRKDLFHIDWILCDDPADPCGLSLDGPIDDPAEGWTYDAVNSNMTGGTLIFTNTMHIGLADTSAPAINGRLTMTLTDGTTGAPAAFAPVTSMDRLTPRLGSYGAEILGTAFTLVALIEVQDPATSVWTPYLDYYDAASTPEAGGGASVSFGGSFYGK